MNDSAEPNQVFGGSWDVARPAAPVRIVAEVSQAQAMALAQFCKRLYLEDVRPRTTTEDEADLMFEGLMQLRAALNAAGFDPR